MLCRSQSGSWQGNISPQEDYQDGLFPGSLEKQATNPMGLSQSIFVRYHVRRGSGQA